MSIDQVNPKLKEAMEDIKKILKHHDIMGCVLLCSGEQSEYLNYIGEPLGPSWSALSWEKQGVRFKATAKTGGHNERFRYVSTLKAIHTMRSLCNRVFTFYDGLAASTEHLVGVSDGGMHVTHEEHP